MCKYMNTASVKLLDRPLYVACFKMEMDPNGNGNSTGPACDPSDPAGDLTGPYGDPSLPSGNSI